MISKELCSGVLSFFVDELIKKLRKSTLLFQMKSYNLINASIDILWYSL